MLENDNLINNKERKFWGLYIWGWGGGRGGEGRFCF